MSAFSGQLNKNEMRDLPKDPVTLRVTLGKCEYDSRETLQRVKAAWKNGMREWFARNPGARNTVQDFVYDKVSKVGIKTYDELSAIELVLRRGLNDDSYKSALEQFGIVVTPGQRPESGSSATGKGDWTGSKITFDASKQEAFHKLNLSLIERDWKRPFGWGDAPVRLTSENQRVPQHLCVVTDPRTDPTEDDAASLCALVEGNRQFKIWDTIHILVTGCAGSLDARFAGIANLACIEENQKVSIEVAPVFHRERREKSRFLAPYGGMPPAAKPLEAAACADGKHVVDRIPECTTDLLVIGQVPEDFFSALQTFSGLDTTNLGQVSIQGPGFNLMGVPNVDDVGAQISDFLNTNKSLQFYWSDNTSGLMITAKQANARIEALGEKLHSEIPAMRSACITSFWATAGNSDQFEGQFGNFEGYNYAAHTAELLREVIQAATKETDAMDCE